MPTTTTASTAATSVPPAVTMGDLAHVALTVTDLSVSVPWYKRVFNRAPVLDEDTGPFRHVAFALGSTLFALHAFPVTVDDNAPVRPPPAGPGPRLVRLPRPHHTRRMGNPAGPPRHRARRDRRRRLRLRALLQRPRRTPTRGVLPTQRVNLVAEWPDQTTPLLSGSEVRSRDGCG
jgi:catechol 2,3-dioxygenase-like lactoylglutathione lyase family enzyme